MGFKRPFDVEFPELPFKLPKHESENNPTSCVETLGDALEKPDVSARVDGEDGIQKFNWYGGDVNGTETDISVCNDKDVKTNASSSWATSTSEDGANYGAFYPGYFDFDLPRRVPVFSENIYSSLLNGPPRRQVPIGPDHQAALPGWLGHERKQDGVDETQKFLGSCVIPMPESDLSSIDNEAGVGRRDCGCLDEGSVRCVQQHIFEAREKLKKAIGEEKFDGLGFYDMGEVVASRWSEEEERLFHEVVFSNPQSLGRNFWKQLSAMFPSRTNKELVSYYFNVFMLRRRVAQNRSDVLNIDSDDDEWYGSNEGSYETQIAEEDEDSGVESPVVLGDQTKFEDRFPIEDDAEEDDSDDDNSGDVNGYENNWNVGCLGGSPGKKSGISNFYEASTPKPSEKGKLDSVVEHGGFSENFDVQDDSGTSFEFNMDDSRGPDAKVTAQVMGDDSDRSKCLSSKINDSTAGADHAYMLESCDAKVWDGRYQSGPVKGVDLLPTSNIIEEIFGLGSWDSKPKDD